MPLMQTVQPRSPNYCERGEPVKLTPFAFSNPTADPAGSGAATGRSLRLVLVFSRFALTFLFNWNADFAGVKAISFFGSFLHPGPKFFTKISFIGGV